MSTWIKKINYTETFEAIEKLRVFAFTPRTRAGFNRDATSNDFMLRREVVSTKLALSQLFDTKEIQQSIFNDLKKIDTEEIASLNPNKYHDKEAIRKIREAADSRSRQFEQTLLTIDQDASTLLCNITLDKVLQYQDHHKNPMVNNRILHQCHATIKAIDHLLQLKSSSDHIKDNLDKVGIYFKHLEHFKTQLKADLRLAIERANLLDVRKKLHSLLPTIIEEQSNTEIKEESKTHSINEISKNVHSLTQSHSESELDDFSPLVLEPSLTLIQAIEEDIAKKRLHIEEQSRRIQEIKGLNDQHIESIDQLRHEKSELERNVTLLNDEINEYKKDSSQLRDQYRDLIQQKDDLVIKNENLTAHNKQLDLMLTEALDQLKHVETHAQQTPQNQPLKSLVIALVTVVGIGLIASGVGSLAGFALLSGLGLAFGITAAATGGFLVSLAGLFYWKNQNDAAQHQALLGAVKQKAANNTESLDSKQPQTDVAVTLITENTKVTDKPLPPTNETTEQAQNTHHLVKDLLEGESNPSSQQGAEQENHFIPLDKKIVYVREENSKDNAAGFSLAHCLGFFSNKLNALFGKTHLTSENPEIEDGLSPAETFFGKHYLAEQTQSNGADPENIAPKDADKNEPSIITQAP